MYDFEVDVTAGLYDDQPPLEDWPGEPPIEGEVPDWRQIPPEGDYGPPLPDDLVDNNPVTNPDDDIEFDGPGDTTIIIGVSDTDGDGQIDGGSVTVKVPLR